MNFNKYDRPKPQKPPIHDRKESVPVILLFEYLKIKSDAGIKLCQDDDILCLCFNPGLSRADQETGRWTIAENVERLFMDAVDDLKELFGNGKLTLPVCGHRHFKKFPGPSWDSETIRIAKPQ